MKNEKRQRLVKKLFRRPIFLQVVFICISIAFKRKNQRKREIGKLFEISFLPKI